MSSFNVFDPDDMLVVRVLGCSDSSDALICLCESI